MSQAKITKEDVARVRENLKAEGKKPTLKNIRAVLGQGSDSTLWKFKNELEAEELAATDSPTMVKAFRAIYEEAVAEGKSQRDIELEELEATLVDISEQADQSKLEAAAARLQAEDVAKKLEETTAKLSRTTEDLACAREASERHAAKLIVAGETHSQEIKKLRDQAEGAKERFDREICQLRTQGEKANELHRLELAKSHEQLATAVGGHRLEVEKLQHQFEKAGELHREELKEMRDKAEKLDERHRREIDDLLGQLDRDKTHSNDLAVKLARAEALLGQSGDAPAVKEPSVSSSPNGR